MTLLLSNADVARVLTPAMTRRALEQAYRDLAAGEAVCRPRIDIRIPTRAADRFYQWGTMEGGSTRGYFALRLKSDIVYERRDHGVATEEKYAARPGMFCGLILLTDVESAVPLALIQDGLLQHLRVAADSAVGTDLMARPDASVLAMIGSGGMARSHLESLREVRELREVRVYSPTPENRARYAREMSERCGIACRAVGDPREACRGADILAACTDSAEPVIQADWIEPGMHVVSIGGRPSEAARARFDRTLRLGTAPAPVGRPELGTADEYLGYLARPADARWSKGRGGRRAPAVTGRGDDVHYADVVSGAQPGRRTRDEVTYSERGNIQGAQFYAVAAAAFEAARAAGLGRDIPTEWLLQDIRD